MLRVHEAKRAGWRAVTDLDFLRLVLAQIVLIYITRNNREISSQNRTEMGRLIAGEAKMSLPLEQAGMVRFPFRSRLSERGQ